MEIQTSGYAARQARLVDELGTNLSLREWQSSSVIASFKIMIKRKVKNVKFTVKGVTEEQFVKRVFYTAWKACGGTSGLGFLQDRGSDMSEEDVWVNVKTNGDYPGTPSSSYNKYYGDYVFGRMMKMGTRCEDGIIEIYPNDPVTSYNAWAIKFPTAKALVDATAKSFHVPVTVTPV